MKVLSIQQPWAWLILMGHKDVENRTWCCHHRGPLLVHAGKTIDNNAVEWLLSDERTDHPSLPKDTPIPAAFATGAIVGRVDVVDCRRHSDETTTSEWHNENCWGIYLRNPILFSCPIESKGQLGVYALKVGDEEAVQEQIERAALRAERTA